MDKVHSYAHDYRHNFRANVLFRNLLKNKITERETVLFKQKGETVGNTSEVQGCNKSQTQLVLFHSERTHIWTLKGREEAEQEQSGTEAEHMICNPRNNFALTPSTSEALLITTSYVESVRWMYAQKHRFAFVLPHASGTLAY